MVGGEVVIRLEYDHGMARPEMLVPGNCYFCVGFYDRHMRYPMIETLTYIGQDECPDLGFWGTASVSP
jgi:hypothetical protein